MTLAVHGLAVARGIAIGRAVLIASSRVDVAHYFIEPNQVEHEIRRLSVADRKSTRLNSSHMSESRMPSSA